MATFSKEFLAQYGVDVNSNKIINLATPTANTDAATKLYVDNQLTAAAVVNTSTASAALSSNTITFTRDDSSTFTLDVSSLVTNATPSFTDLTLTGNLTVQGTTTTLDTTNLVVNDAIITLASGQTGTPALDAGFEIERGTSANVALKWNETTDKWQLTEDGSTYVNIATATDISNIANTSLASAAFDSTNNTITLTRDDASTTTVDIGSQTSNVTFADANSTLTFTRADSTTFDVAIRANTSVASGSYTAANNTLTLTRADSSTTDISIVTSATTVSNTAPSSPLEGDLWYDSDDADLYIYYDGAFVAVVPTPANTSTSSASFAAANSTLTFTRADASTFDVALRANTSTTSAAWTSSNNTLVFTRDDATTFDVTLDKLPETSTTTVSSTSQVAVDSFSISTFSAAQYIVEATNGSDKHFTMVNVTQDGTDVYLTEYGTIITNTSLMTLDADINSGNLRLLATPANSSGTIKIKRTNVAA